MSSSIDKEHQTLRRCRATQPAVVQMVLCSTDDVATDSWADVRQWSGDVASAERRAAEYDDCHRLLRICYRESQWRCVEYSGVMIDVNRWTDAAVFLGNRTAAKKSTLTSLIWYWFTWVLFLWLTINVVVGDSTAWSGFVSCGSWTRLSSSPSESNCIRCLVSRDVTSKRVDVTESENGLTVSDEDFGSQSFMWAPSADTRQTQSSRSTTYSWDVRSQATMSCGYLKSLTSMSVSLWYVVASNLTIAEDSRQTMWTTSCNWVTPRTAATHNPTHSRYRLYLSVNVTKFVLELGGAILPCCLVNSSSYYFWRTSKTYKLWF